MHRTDLLLASIMLLIVGCVGGAGDDARPMDDDLPPAQDGYAEDSYRFVLITGNATGADGNVSTAACDERGAPPEVDEAQKLIRFHTMPPERSALDVLVVEIVHMEDGCDKPVSSWSSLGSMRDALTTNVPGYGDLTLDFNGSAGFTMDGQPVPLDREATVTRSHTDSRGNTWETTITVRDMGHWFPSRIMG